MVDANDLQPNRKTLNRRQTAVVGMMLTGGFLCNDEGLEIRGG